MTDDELLDLVGRAHTEFARRLALIAPEDYSAPTPCDGWDVRDLVEHVLGGSVRYRLMLDGASRPAIEETRAVSHLGDDPVESFEAGANALGATFAEPGALDRIAGHRAGDCPGRELAGLRILECALHSWDLARAIGVDDRLDPALLAAMDSGLGPLLERLRAAGFYAEALPAPVGASTQDRVLLQSGRRP